MGDLTVTPEEMPEWLTVDFFRKLLAIHGKVTLESVEFACAKGDNFCSKIFRVVMRFEDETTKSVVVKSRPIGSGFSEEFMKKFNVFPKEIEMYQNIELFEEIFRKNGYEITFAPKCLKVTTSPTDILIIEDLSAKDYRMAKKSDGLNKIEMEMVLKKLAQFHASSAVYVEQRGELDEKFARGVYNEDMKDVFGHHYDFNFTYVMDEFFSTWPDLDKRIIDKMRNWRQYVLKELIRSMTPKPNQFKCLAHGDAWIANILLHYDSDGRLDDCQFIDFQQSVYTSPAIDLLSLIFTSAETETKLQNFEHFVKFYHEQLVDALELLKYSKSIPSLKELYLDVLDRSFLGVWHCFAVLPQCLVENVQESSTDNLLGESEEARNYKKKLYNNVRYRKHMTELLTYFNLRGLVDLP